MNADFQFDFRPVPTGPDTTLELVALHRMARGADRRTRATPEADAAYEADRRTLADRRTP